MIDAAAAATQTLASAAKSTSTTGADFNMFLKLLTTQMQNQDPLDPMKTSEYTQQLVQYSQIEQTVQQSGTLKEILANMSTQDLSQASSLIGRVAVFNSAISGLTSSAPATWNYAPAGVATSMVATITDATGKAVATRTVDPTAPGHFSWDGATTVGGTAAPGSYTLSIAALAANGAVVPVAINSTGTVTNITTTGGVVSLGVNGVALPVAALLKVAAPNG